MVSALERSRRQRVLKGWKNKQVVVDWAWCDTLDVCVCVCVCPSTGDPLGFPVSSDLYQIKGDANIQLDLGPLQRSSFDEWRKMEQTPGENSCRSSRPPLISNLKGLSPAASSPQQIGSASTSPRPLTAPFWERIVMNLISPKSLPPHHTHSSSHFLCLTVSPRTTPPWFGHHGFSDVNRDKVSLLQQMRCKRKLHYWNKVEFVFCSFFLPFQTLFSSLATFLFPSTLQLLQVNNHRFSCVCKGFSPDLTVSSQNMHAVLIGNLICLICVSVNNWVCVFPVMN